MFDLIDLSTVTKLGGFFTTSLVIFITWIVIFYLKSRERYNNFRAKYSNQSHILKTEGIRTSQINKEGPLVDTMADGESTLHEVFQRGLRIAPDVPCLGWRRTPKSPYEWLTYSETYKKVMHFGSGLVTLQSGNGDELVYVGVYAVNCVEWAVAQQACSSFSFVIVPLYDTLGEQARKYILFQTQMRFCVCDSVTRVRNILSDLNSVELYLKYIIIINPQDQLEALRKEADGRVQIYCFDDVLILGEKNPCDIRVPKSDDLHLINYTSGTTGKPKGVLVTHRMILSVIGSFEFNFVDVNFGIGDYYLSFLPLAHVFEQLVIHYAFGHGSSVGFLSGDLRNLSEDILALRPTVFCAVPRVLQRLYATVQAAVADSLLKRLLLRLAYAAKMHYVRQGIVTNTTFWDRYILREIQDRMGGRLRCIAVGSAPISKEVYQFCRAVLGVHAFEAYGLTETCGAIVMTLSGDLNVGHVGAPLPCSRVKLFDVPDMGYIVSRDGIGEICVQGPGCTAGYFKDEQRTLELIDSQKWLHTGDIGTWTENGCLKLVDRCKNMFKLAQGEYVSPERVELIYGRSRFVDQVFLDGHSGEWFAVAIVVPNIEALHSALSHQNGSILNGSLCKTTPNNASNKFTSMSNQEICNSLEAKKLVLNDLIRLGKDNDLKGFEQAKSIFLSPNPFSVADGLLTPTQKICRGAFRQHFKEQIANMYRQNSMV